MDQGILVVISGPSGAGKGTVCNELRCQKPELNYSISATTRPPRAGEQDGINYFFLTRDKFKELIKADLFLEYAEVYGNFYGTPKDKVTEFLATGKDVLLEIDIQGALQVKKKFSDGIFIFIMPPSIEELKKRIVERGSETPESLAKRLGSAAGEMVLVNEYDYVVINDDVKICAAKIAAIMLAEKLKVKRNQEMVKLIIN